ncbi:MAG: response regulator transcription factor [Kiritimatiellae bacterium]|jgi:NarL family two-component system response regulator LiaR|nr:response regulator transcription factor [Kiritimatiellia bacterium]
MKPITILLVDDHAVMRMGLASLLETCGDVEVIGDTGDGESAIKKALKLRPDVVLMDLVMPEMDGIETTQRLLEKWPEANVLILTTFATSDGINRALEAGAKGAILKNSDLKGLRAAIHDVAEGKRHCSAEVEQIMTDDPPIPELSSRQQEILNSIVRGLSNPDIARQLGISLPMVKEHLTSLFAKLGVANRTEAVALALRKQLLKI